MKFRGDVFYIVGTLQRMLILRTILWNQSVEDSLHIDANIWITVFVDAQSATGVFRENVHNAGLRQFRQLTYYLARHKMESATFRFQGYFYLLYLYLITVILISISSTGLSARPVAVP